MKKFQSKIIASTEWPRIKEVIENNINKKSISAIYKIALGIDKNIGHYTNFKHFVNNWTKELLKRQELAVVDVDKNTTELLQDINDQAIENVDLLDRSARAALELGDAVLAHTLTEVKEKIEKGKKINFFERKAIMSWWAEAGRIVYEGETLKLKRMAGARDTVALGLLARAARSGNLPESDLPPVEGEIIKEQINEPQTTNQAQQSVI